MNLQVFQNAASTRSMHVILVNSDATMLEGNSSGMFKIYLKWPTHMWQVNKELSLLLYSKKKYHVFWYTAVLTRLNNIK